MIEIQVKKTKFLDIDTDFNLHPITKDVSKKVDVNAISTAMKSLVMTRKYDRKFHPEISSQVMDMLFELMTLENLAAVKTTLYYVLENFEPRVSIISIDVTPTDTALGVTVIYKIVGVIDTIKTQFYLDRTL